MWGLRLFHICGDPIHTYVIKCGSFLLLLSHVDLLIRRAEGPTRVEKDSTLLPYLYNQNNRCLSNSIMKGPNRWAQAPSSPVSDPQHRPPRASWTSHRTSRNGVERCPFPRQNKSRTTEQSQHTLQQVSAHTSEPSHTSSPVSLNCEGQVDSAPGGGELRGRLQSSAEGRCRCSLGVQLCSRKCGSNLAPS